MNIQLIRFREQVLKAIREYFYRQDFHEVIIPILQKTVPLEPNIYPFATTGHSNRRTTISYLPTSPESICLKYLAAGGGNCFAISPAFRDFEDTSPIHTPEFLMLEWYKEKSSYEDTIKETKQLILFIQKRCVFGTNPILDGNRWSTHTMEDLFQKYVGISLYHYIGDKKMIALAQQKSYETKGASWEQLFHQVFLNEIQPHFGKNPVFVTDYPLRISPLCKPKENAPGVAERFELYIRGMEIANGNTQNTDKDYLLTIFMEEQKLRNTMNGVSPPIDRSFLTAIKKLKTKGVCGVGLGIDRLAMLLSGANNLQELGITNRI